MKHHNKFHQFIGEAVAAIICVLIVFWLIKTIVQAIFNSPSSIFH